MFGKIFSYDNTPSVDTAYFQIEEGIEVSKGEFVCLEHPKGKAIGMIVDIFRQNPYFESSAVGAQFEHTLPVDEWHTSIAQIKLLGLLEGKSFKRISCPPYAGSQVNEPEYNDLKKFLGFREEGLELGFIDTKEKKVKVDLSRLLQKHLAILAMSGAGKSYSVSVLLEELLGKKNSLGVVLFDVHGEYKNFAEPTNDPNYKDYSSNVNYYDASKLKFALHTLDDALFMKIMGNVSATGYRELSPILRDLRSKMSEGELFDFEDIREEIKQRVTKTNVRDPLIGSINQFENLGLFGKTSNFRIEDIVQSSKLTIIDMSNILDMTHKQIILAYFASTLFRKRQTGILPPFSLVLEEAHQFVPEGSSQDYMKARSIIETVAREGRKFGASLCLISQRPVKLSTTVLSQCNTHLLLRIINPNDLKHILESSEGLDSKSVNIITGLNVGEALMVGSAINYPLFFSVRERTSAPNKYELNLEQMAKEFAEKKRDKDKELDSFI